MFLVGELSKFPLPYNSWEGEWLAYVAPGALALCRQRDPRTSWFTTEKPAQKSPPPERWSAVGADA